jgi:hypothetical protein
MAVGWWTHFGVAGRKSSLEEQARRRGVVGRRGTAVGAASGGGGRRLECGEVVHGGTVLGAWSKWSERGWSLLPAAVAGMAVQWGAKSGGGRKGAPRWGVGALYSG